MKSIRPALLLALPVLLLASCGDGEGSASSSQGGSGFDPTQPVAGVKEALALLSEARNYTAYVQLSSTTGGVGMYYCDYFTEDYFFSDEYEDEHGYASSSEGIYPLAMRMDEEGSGKIVGGELSGAEGDLYSSGLFPTVADIDSSSWEEGLQSLDLSGDKLAKITLLELFGFEPDRLLDIDSASIDLLEGGDSLLDLSIQITMGLTRYEMSFDEFGSTAYEPVESFLAEGGSALVLDERLSFAKEGFLAENFIRDVINYVSGESQGTERYTPHYFYGSYTGDAALYSGGYMGIRNKEYQGKVLNGTYMFIVDGVTVTPMFQGAYNNDPDITSPNVFNYPGNMDLWNRLELFGEEGEGAYVTYDSALIADFISNNQAASFLSEISAEPVSLSIAITDPAAEANTVVTFSLDYESPYGDGSCVYPFTSFGTANIPAVDDFMEENNLL